MRTVTASYARANLGRLIEDAAASHQPIQITGRGGVAVLVSADEWKAIRETLRLGSIPGMAESIKHGMAEPVGKSARKLPW